MRAFHDLASGAADNRTLVHPRVVVLPHPRVILVCDRPMLRTAIASLLAFRGGADVFEVERVEQVPKLAAVGPVDLVIVDAGSCHPDLTLVARFARAHTGANVVLIEASASLPFARRTPWDAVLTPHDDADELLATCVSLVGRDFAARADGLTPRQREVMQCVAAGFSNARIGATLGLTVATVKQHMTNICERLGVRTRHEALDVLRASTRRPVPAEGAASVVRAVRQSG